MAKLLGLHIFYQNNLQEGFGVGLDDQFFTDHLEAQDNFVTASQMSIEFYKELHTDRARQEFIANIQSQFNQVCQWFHQHKGQAMDEDWIAYFVLLLDDMTFLQSLDLFPNNDYNGVQWVWFNG